MDVIVSSQRPKVTEKRIAEILVERGVRDPVAVVGWPGWFAAMGRPGNDRGIYDDAIIVASPTAFAAFNGNVDPKIEDAVFAYVLLACAPALQA